MRTIDTSKAYRISAYGSPVRLAILRTMSAESVNNRNEATRLQPGDWKGARRHTLASYESAYGMLSQGFNGTNDRNRVPVWYCHAGEYFRGERDASDITRDLPGYYTDMSGHENAIGIVARLPHGRFLAGYRWTSNRERVYFSEVFTDDEDAARAADSHAEHFAESARADSERFDAMQNAELDCETLCETLRGMLPGRNASEYLRDKVRETIEQLRGARETLADATRAYEGAQS